MPAREATTDTALGSELLSVIARLNRWSSRHVDCTLPMARARLLAQIEDLKAARIGDLAQADHCSQPAMTTLVRRLEGAGLVRRKPDSTDARAVLISLTPKGRKVLHDVREARTQVIGPLIQRLADNDREHLRGAVRVLNRLLEAATDETRPPGTEGRN